MFVGCCYCCRCDLWVHRVFHSFVLSPTFKQHLLEENISGSRKFDIFAAALYQKFKKNAATLRVWLASERWDVETPQQQKTRCFPECTSAERLSSANKCRCYCNDNERVGVCWCILSHHPGNDADAWKLRKFPLPTAVGVFALFWVGSEWADAEHEHPVVR